MSDQKFLALFSGKGDNDLKQTKIQACILYSQQKIKLQKNSYAKDSRSTFLPRVGSTFFFYRVRTKKTKHKKFCPFLHGLYSMNMTFWTYISSRKKTAINAKISLCRSFSLNPSSFFLHCFSFSRSASISAFKGIVYGQTNFQIKIPSKNWF